MTKIDFRDTDHANALLARISAQLSPALATSLPALLRESPDPDSSLIFLERLIGQSPEIKTLFDRHSFLAHYALVVFGHSRFLGETLIQNTDLFPAFLREKNLDRSFARDDFREMLARFRSRSQERDISLLLARFKRREYVRIMLRDVLKLAPLSETTAEISALSDVLIEEALRETQNRLTQRYGQPQHLDRNGRLVETPFTVISLGKLGGNELNYSSDIDLMYIFGDGEESPAATISNHEYFVRLAQEITSLLSCATREGPVFRIDLRLRPQGNEGEMAVSLSHALRYYASRARDWERQALIKIRHSAGDEALAREFIRNVQPYVYGCETISGETAVEAVAEENPRPDLASTRLNFAAIKTALDSLEKMHLRRRQQMLAEPENENSIDVKLDAGGIRDIEFLVQCLQRVYGGVEPWLRSHGTLFSLQKLHDKRHISGREFHDLTSAYEFLRHLEHRLQLRNGLQTHRLVKQGPKFEILQRAMEGYAPGMDQGVDLIEIVQRHMEAVEEIQQRIIYQQSARGHLQAGETSFALSNAADSASIGFSNQQMLERLSNDSPALHQIAKSPELGPAGRKNLFRFFSSAFTSSERYAAVLGHPDVVARALPLFETSAFLSDILVRHPEEISALAGLTEHPPRRGSGYLFSGELAQDRAASDPVFAYLATSSLSHAEKVSLLRRHYRHRALTLGAKDIAGSRNIYESLAATSAAAEDAIAAAFGVAGSPAGLAVLALGRLGSGEFDVLSDADLIFVCEEGMDTAALSPSVEGIIQTLSAYTRDGMVFPVDARLRPRGGEGELLMTPSQLTSYFSKEAQPWEALMYTKLRFIAGSRKVADSALGAARSLFERFAASDDFLSSVYEMRRKLESSDGSSKNLKTSPGGTYDVDFLTGFLMVKHRIRETHGTMRDRIWRCAGHNVLKKADAAALDHAMELFRTVEHLIRLVSGRALRWLPGVEHAREVTSSLASKILAHNFSEGLEKELLKASAEVRSIYSQIISA